MDLKVDLSEAAKAKQNYSTLSASGKYMSTLVKTLSLLGNHLEHYYPGIYVSLSGRIKNQKSLFNNINLCVQKNKPIDVFDILGLKMTVTNFDLDTLLESPHSPDIHEIAYQYQCLLTDMKHFEDKYQNELSADIKSAESLKVPLLELVHDTYDYKSQMLLKQKDAIRYEISKFLIDDICADTELLDSLGLENPTRIKNYTENYKAKHVTLKVSNLPNTYIELQGISKANEKNSRVGEFAHYLMSNKEEMPNLEQISSDSGKAKRQLAFYESYVPQYVTYVSNSNDSVHILSRAENFFAYYIDTPNGLKYVNDYVKKIHELEQNELSR